MKRRVEAESFEEEAREKDLSLAEVVQIVCSKHIIKPIPLLWTLTLSHLGGGATDSRKSEAKSSKQRRCARAQVQGGQS